MNSNRQHDYPLGNGSKHKKNTKSVKEPALVEEELRKVPEIKGAYVLSEGYFLIEYSSGWKIEKCRELMQTHFDDYPQLNVFYFCAGGPVYSQRVIKFITLVEAAAGVDKDDQVNIELTNDKAVLYVAMSAWWRSPLRRSLLTVLLRCGRNYVEESGKGFKAALNSVEYTQKTQKAIDLFLSGHTGVKNKSIPKEGFGGWYAVFSQANFDPSRVLVRIKRKKIPEKSELKNAAD